jgi:hypothetical protein
MSFLTHCDTFLNGLHYALPHFDTMLSLLDGIYLVLLLTPCTLSICYERSSRSSSRMRVLDIVVALLLLRTHCQGFIYLVLLLTPLGLTALLKKKALQGYYDCFRRCTLKHYFN